LLTSLVGYTQTGIDTPFLFDKDHFSFSLINSFNISKFKNTYGTDQPHSGLGRIHELNMKYQFNFNKKFGLGLNGGFGFFPFITRVDPKGDYDGTSGWRYFQIVQYQLFGQSQIDFSYRFNLNKKNFISLNLGFGARFFSNLNSGSTWHTQTDIDHATDLEITSIPKCFLNAGFGFNRPLKNQDLLVFNFNFLYSFSDIFTGDFEVYGGTSGGDYFNHGHSFGFGIEYVFTKAKKATCYSFLRSTTFVTSREIRKKIRKDKRYIDPSTIFISAGTGLFFGKNKVPKNNDAFKSGASESWNIYAHTEIGLMKNFFYEFNYCIQQYLTSQRHNLDWLFFSGSSGNAFIGQKISTGVGYRVIFKKSNFNIITIRAGLAATVHFDKKGWSGGGGGSAYSPSTGHYFNYSETSSITHNIMPTIYLGLTKDFKLTQNLMISIGYRYDLGFVTGERTTITYEHDGHPEPQTFDSVINGTSSTYTVGLKYGFVPKSKRSEN